ncbi:hypothetical protein [Pseudomonas panipatensis]|uniref:hypothetical protein n=1 Tax=Pseudomonas panipatensis TaxID=428992 RepID=UPI0035B0ABBE
MNPALSHPPTRESHRPTECSDQPAPTERAAAWSPRAEDAQHQALFDIRAEAEADTLCRLLNLIVVHGYPPAEVHAVQDGDWLQVRLRVPRLPRQRAGVIAARLRSLVDVAGVDLAFRAI